MIKQKEIFIFFFTLFVSLKPLYAEQKGIIRKNGIIILFEKSLEIVGQEVADIYPYIKTELEETFKWKLNFTPKILLVTNKKFAKMVVPNNFIIAFTVPRKKIVVINFSKISSNSFKLRTVLKHELCHLLLHHYIKNDNLPRWFDEGICQWVSNGITEIIMNKRELVLQKAVISKTYIPIRDLTKKFPENKEKLLLAYEQSKSLVEYIVNEFGRERVLNILKYLKDGNDINMAIEKSLLMSFDDLEKRWQTHLSKKSICFSYLENNLYEILFFLAALITLCGFIRRLKKKRACINFDKETF